MLVKIWKGIKGYKESHDKSRIHNLLVIRLSTLSLHQNPLSRIIPFQMNGFPLCFCNVKCTQYIIVPGQRGPIRLCPNNDRAEHGLNIYWAAQPNDPLKIFVVKIS